MQKLIFAILLSAIVCMVVGRFLIPMLRRLKFGQTERQEGPESHLKKTGTPTMGGIMIIVAIVIGTMALSSGSLHYALPAMPVSYTHLTLPTTE